MFKQDGFFPRFFPFWAALLFFALIVILLPSQPFNDPGVFWHVDVGQWICSQLTTSESLAQYDRFSFTFNDKIWVPQQWLAEWFMAKIFEPFGWDGLLLTMAFLVALPAGYLAGKLYRTGLHPIACIFIVGFGVSASAFHFYCRPHMVTMTGFALLGLAIVRIEKGGVPLYAWFLIGIPATVLWTNLHAGIVAALVTMGFCCVLWEVSRWVGGRTPFAGPASFWLASGVLILLGLATYINPFGWNMHRTWLSIMDAKIVRETVREHQPLSLATNYGRGIVYFAAFYAFLLVGRGTWPRVSHCVPILWFGFTLMSIRHGPLFCFLALAMLPDILPETVYFRYFQAKGDLWVSRPRVTISFWRTVIWTVLLWEVCILSFVFRTQQKIAGSKSRHVTNLLARFDPEYIPLDMMEALEKEYRGTIASRRIFNDANYGGLLIWFFPSWNIFMDDRCELYGDAWIRNYVDMMYSHPEKIEAYYERYLFDLVLVNKDEPMDKYLRARPEVWELRFEGKFTVFFVRKESFWRGPAYWPKLKPETLPPTEEKATANPTTN